MTVRCVLFDLDNTLIDRSCSIEEFVPVFIQDYSDLLRIVDVEFIKYTFHQMDGGGYTPKLQGFRMLLEVLPWQSKPDVYELREYWREVFPRCSVAMQGAFDLLNTLWEENYRLGIITNGLTRKQHAKIDQLGLKKYIEFIIISEAVQLRKPDKAIFHLAIEQQNLTPSECIYVGDHPINDIIGSSQAGLIPVWLKGYHEWPSDMELPQWQIDSLESLLPVIHRISQFNSDNKIAR